MNWTMPRSMEAFTVPEAAMLRAIHAVQLPEPVHQHRFVPRCCKHPKAKHHVSDERYGSYCRECFEDSTMRGPSHVHQFEAGRRWRLDFAWPDRMVALEVEGLGRREKDGTWNPTGGGHQTRDGFTKNCEKYNEVVLAGWVLIRVTSAMITDGRAIEFVERALGKD